MLGTSTTAEVTLIVPVYNGGELFRVCLQHIEALDPAPKQFIVIGDGDTDGSRTLAAAAGATVLTSPTPQGPAHARNLAAGNAEHPILFFVDADVALPADALAHIVDAFQAESAPDALIGSYDDAPSALNFLSQYKNLLHHFVHQTSSAEASTFWGACGAIRRDIFLEMGGFDEGYQRPAIEDIELGYRLAGVGYRIRLLKTLQVKHLKRWTAGSLVRTDFLQRALPWSRLLLRNKALGNDFERDLNLQTASRISVVLAFLLLGTLLLAPWWSYTAILAGMAAAGLLWLNAPVYRFFQRKRGIGFAIRSIPWHWFYYLYSGLAFGIVYLEHLFTTYTALGETRAALHKEQVAVKSANKG